MKQLQTGLLVGMILFAAGIARADTTWVAGGATSGTWTTAGSPYMITQGIVEVPVGSQLTIQPGVKVYGEGPYLLVIHGTLTAIGTAQDSIIFTAFPSDTAEQAWRGIYFSATALATSQISYATLENANGPGYESLSGGAIQVRGSSPHFDHCLIRSNMAVLTHDRLIVNRRGGGVFCAGGAPQFSNCVITDNDAGPSGWGGGVFCGDTTTASFQQCTIEFNVAGGGGGIATRQASPTFSTCSVTQNSASYDGGGVLCEEGDPVFTECAISSNVSTQYGGGVYVIGSAPQFTRCEISNNQSFWGGGIFCIWNPGPLLGYSVIHNNVAALGGGIYSWRAHPTILVSTITHNTSTLGDGGGLLLNKSILFMSSSIVAHSYGGEGIYFLNSPGVEIQSCDFALNSGGAFGFDPDEHAGPAGIGELVATNRNGDSCDTYVNIFFDPQFVDAAGGDYHLNWNSPCIDAGYEWDDPDPDGSMPDIGAYYRDAAPAALPPLELPREVALAQNYPNPFNASTQITFDLPQTGDVRLSVYDITGREVLTQVRGMLAAGSHAIRLDAANLPSGVYLYRLTAANVSLTRKLVLIK